MKRLSVICGLMLLATGLSGCAYDPAPYGAYGYGPRYSYVPPPAYGYGYGPSASAVYVTPGYGYPVVRPAPVRIYSSFGYRGGWGGGHGGWGGEHRGGGWGGGHYHGH